MTPQQIVGSALRLLAAILAIKTYFVVQLSISGEIAAANDEMVRKIPELMTMTWISNYIFACIYLLLAAAMWLFPMTIAHRLLPRKETYDAAQEWLCIVCVVMGLWVITDHALWNVANIVNVFVRRLDGLSLYYYAGYQALYIVIALALILKADVLSSFLLRCNRRAFPGEKQAGD